MQKKQVLINAIMSILQVVVISGVLFILYKFLLKTIGVELLGIWSLVLATTSLTQIANFGLSGSVIKYVARYIARGENENISKVIQTAALSVGAFSGVILLIAYPVAASIFNLVIPPESIHYALAILPFAFFALWIMMITSVFQASLDGYQRIDHRSLLLMGGGVLLLLLCFLLVPLYGLMGVVWARVIQNLTILFVSWFLVKRQLSILPFLPYKWNRNIFKEIIGYSMNFQLMTFTSLIFDPITKAFLSKFGGLSMVGYYEMANRMIVQFRALIVQANQVLVPVIANLQENNLEKVKSVYLTSYQLLFYLAVPLYSLIIVCTPVISELWIGHYERVFVHFAILLVIGWFLNTLNVPAFTANLGTGELRWNVIGQISIAVLNIVLGFLLGVIYGGKGVVIGWMFSLALGSSIVYLSYHIKHNIPLIELLPKASRVIIVTCLTGILSVLIIHVRFNHVTNIIALNGIIFFSFLLIIFFPLWVHPMRKTLRRWVVDELLKNPQKG